MSSKPYTTVAIPIAGATQRPDPHIGTGGGTLDNPALYVEGDAARIAEERVLDTTNLTGIEEVPGDLGVVGRTFDTLVLLAQARRDGAEENILTRMNFRFRGPREAPKFLLLMQRVMGAAARISDMLRAKDAVLAGLESGILLTADDMRAIYHIREQLKFHEWLLLRDSDKRWLT